MPKKAALAVAAAELSGNPEGDAGLQFFPEGTEVITVYVDDPAPTAPPPPTAAPAPTATPAPTAVPAPTITYPTYSAGSAGDVVLAFDGSNVTFWAAYPAEGWQYGAESQGPGEVKVKFLKTEGKEKEVEFKAEVEGSKIKIEVGD